MFRFPILFFKATQKKSVWIPPFTKKDGTQVGGFFKMVHVTDDHDDHAVARGGISHSQKKAHKKVHEDYKDEPGFHALDSAGKAAHVMAHATDAQDAETAMGKVVKYQQKILAGKAPSANEVEAFLQAPQAKKDFVFKKLQSAGESFVDASTQHIEAFLSKTGKTLADFADKKEPEKAPEPKPEPAKAEQPKKPEPEKPKEPEAKQEPTLLDEFKATIEAGGIPSQAMMSKVDALSPADKKSFLTSLAKEMGGMDKVIAKLKEIGNKPEAKKTEAKPAPEKKPEAKAPVEFKVGDAVKGAELSKLPPGTILTAENGGKKRTVLVGNNGFWFGNLNKPGEWQKKQLAPQHVSALYQDGYGPMQVESLGHADWMSPQQANMASKMLESKKKFNPDAQIYKMGKSVVVGEVGNPTSFAWIGEEGGYGMYFNDKQQAKLKSGDGLVLVSKQPEKTAEPAAEKAADPVPEKTPKVTGIQVNEHPAKGKLDRIPWDGIALPESNMNHKTVNKKLAAIKEAAYAGDLATLEAMTFGSNNYAKKLKKTAEVAMAALKESPKAEDGPKNGDTKEGADGTLVFQDGRWHKQGDKASDAKQPIHVISNPDSGLEAHVTHGTGKNAGKFGVALKDTDSGEFLPTVNFYPTEEEAVSSANKAAGIKPKEPEASTTEPSAALDINEKAKELGKQAHAAGFDSPVDDPEFFKLYEQAPDKDKADLVVAWHDGKDSVKSAEPEKPQETGHPPLEIKQFTHSAKGHQVYSVPLPSKLGNDEYKKVAALAKEVGSGFYSSFKKDGAIPGFHFKDEAKAQAFAEQAAAYFGGEKSAEPEKEPEAKPEPAAKEQIKTKIIAGKAYLAKDSGYPYTYANSTQAQKAAKKWQDQGYDVHITASHPFMIVVDGEAKPAETSLQAKIDDAGGLTHAKMIADAHIEGATDKAKATQEAITALENQGYFSAANALKSQPEKPEEPEKPAQQGPTLQAKFMYHVENLLDDYDIDQSSYNKVLSYLSSHPGDVYGAVKELQENGYGEDADKIRKVAEELGVSGPSPVSSALSNSELVIVPEYGHILSNAQLKIDATNEAAVAGDVAKVKELLGQYMADGGQTSSSTSHAQKTLNKMLAKENDSLAKQAAEGDSAPVGTKWNIFGKDMTKTPEGWVVEGATSPLKDYSPLAATAELMSGKMPHSAYMSQAGSAEKEGLIGTAKDNGGDVKQMLGVMFPQGEDGPKEGDIKYINGVNYILKNGRWHKLGEEPADPVENKAPGSLGDLKVPDGLLDSTKNKLNATLASLADGHAHLTISTGSKKITITDKASGWKQQFYNPDTYPTANSEKQYQLLQFLLSAKSLAGGNVNDKLAGIMDNVGYPVAELAGKKPKKKKVEKIVFNAKIKEAKVKAVNGAGVSVMDDWEQTGPQAGSNTGGKYKDGNGQEWYCKFPGDNDVVKNEFLAAKFYQMLGVDVPNLKLVEKNGQLGIASKWVDGLKKGSAGDLASASGSHSAFAIDAWLGNWDVVGLSNDNMMLDKDGKAVRVDVGGSLIYRAQGGKKGDAFGDTVAELKSLLDPSTNAQSHAVFKGISASSMGRGANMLAKLKPSQIEELCQKAGPGSEEDKKALADKLIARRKDVLKQLGVADPWDKPPVDESKLEVNDADLPKPLDFFAIGTQGPTGKWLSSVEKVNQMNSHDSEMMVNFAKQGNLKGLKDYHYEAFDKTTGQSLGLKPITDHPSKQIKEQWCDLVELLSSIAYPPVDTLDMPSLGAAESWRDVSKMVGTFDPTERVETVPGEHRMGFFMKLGQVDDVESLVKDKQWTWIKPTDSFVSTMKSKFSGLNGAIKAYVYEVQATGWINHVWSMGKKLVSASGHGGSYSGGIQSLSAKLYQQADDVPENAQLWRWMGDTTAGKSMMAQLLNAEPGLVIQNTDSMCCSYEESWGKSPHFASDVLMKIRCPKGAKATMSFASGGFGKEYEITTLPGARFVVVETKKGIPGNPNGVMVDVVMLPPHEGYVESLGKLEQIGKSFVILLGNKLMAKGAKA